MDRDGFGPVRCAHRNISQRAIKTKSTTADQIFKAPETISFISQVMDLVTGDIIATGTPGGIGPMQPGDTVEIRIPPIGVLRNYVVKP